MHAVFKERHKLSLRDSKPHGIQTKDEIKFTVATLEPDAKSLFEFEFIPTDQLSEIEAPIEVIKIM